MSTPPIRTCRRCGARLTPGNAVRRRKSPDGLDTVCRPCEAARMRDVYRRHRDAIRERQRLYRQQQKEKEA